MSVDYVLYAIADGMKGEDSEQEHVRVSSMIKEYQILKCSSLGAEVTVEFI